MKKAILLFMAVIGLTACNKKQEIKLVEPPKELVLNVVQNIDGDLGQFAVAKNERIKITFKKDESKTFPGIEYEIPVKIIFSSAANIDAGSAYNNYGPNMEVELLNKEGRVIKECKTHMENSYTDLASLIKAGNNREEWIVFKGRYHFSSLDKESSFEDSKAFIDAISKASFVRIKSEIIKEKFNSDRTESISDDATTDSEADSYSNGNDCDEFLDGYENFMIKYVAMVKRYNKNPTSPALLAEYTEITAEANKWASKGADCKADPKFVARYTEIQMKIASAI